MTRLIIYAAQTPADVLLDTTDFGTIRSEVQAAGATIERWQASHPFADGATSDVILAAYASEIDKLKAARGYASADVISIRPGNPNWAELRQKFLQEHIHDEDEVRFFVSGSGAFYLHIDERIYQVIGEKDDLLSVPAGTKHWFDGGPDGNFTCIRLFTRQDGWIAHFTGSQISQEFPLFAEAA